jgi:alpha-beta hydrolase superfamily lysophospholipase
LFDLAAADRLRVSLAQFAFRAETSLPEGAKVYIEHYGLDFPHAPQLRELMHCMGFFDSGEFQISCQFFAGARERCAGTIFLVHGYYDHTGLYQHVIEYWLRRQFNVLVFDLPGHGLSSGEPAAIDSFDRYQDALDECVRLATDEGLPKPWHILGQSTGCSIIMEYCLRDCAGSRSQFDKAILLAPLVRPFQWARGSLLHALLEPFVDGIPRNFVANSGDQEFLEFVRDNDPLQSRRLSSKWVRALKNWHKTFAAYSSCDRDIAVIQGVEDKTVDWRFNLQAIERKFPRAQFNRLSEARHHLVNERPDIRRKIYGILDQVVPD